MSDQPNDQRRKNTNPKDAVGTRKVPWSVISGPVMAEVGLAMLEGARKYGRHNYRVCGVRASIYFDANMRHLTDWWEGQDIDLESGIHHVTKAIAGLTVLRDSMIQGNWVDDRPPRSPKGWLEALNKKAVEILERIPAAKPACVEGDQHNRCERDCGQGAHHRAHLPGPCAEADCTCGAPGHRFPVGL